MIVVPSDGVIAVSLNEPTAFYLDVDEARELADKLLAAIAKLEAKE